MIKVIIKKKEVEDLVATGGQSNKSYCFGVQKGQISFVELHTFIC